MGHLGPLQYFSRDPQGCIECTDPRVKGPYFGPMATTFQIPTAQWVDILRF